MDYPFTTSLDVWGAEFFTLNLSNSVSWNVSQIIERDGGDDIASLLKAFVVIRRRVAGPFQSDLTRNRDDIILAFLSFILILIIESIVTTLLLRTRAGQVHNFGFSVKQIIELFRELNFRGAFSQKKKDSPNPKKINKNLIILSVSIVFMIVGLEVSILLLTDPKLNSITNEMATFRILQPVTTEWDNFNFHAFASIKRPCESIILEQVEQGFTKLNGCVETDLSMSLIELFKPTKDVVNLKIVSQMHDYGSDHEVTIGNDSAIYRKRVFFTLKDRNLRLMKSSRTSENETEQMNIIHRQFVAYIFTVYHRALKNRDPNMNLARLQSLKFFFKKNSESLKMDILHTPLKQVVGREYITNVKGVLPKGSTVLRFAQQYFRGTAAIVVAPPDRKDLILEKGIEESTVEVWKEKTRVVNWLSLLIFTLACLIVLFILRCIFKPSNIADIAGVYVRSSVGAKLLRSPVEMSEDELKYFRVPLDVDETEYMLGAETAHRQNRRSFEYRKCTV